jgi:hypothetical protein
MKLFVDPIPPDAQDRAILRVAQALKTYMPQHEYVDTDEDADMVIIHAVGRIKSVLSRIKKPYALIQYAIRSTRNPHTFDWLDIWKNAQAVWSYYDLNQLLKDDGNNLSFNFYHAPLGVDTSVFYDRIRERRFIAATSGIRDDRERVRETYMAALAVMRPVFHVGPKLSLNMIYSAGAADDDLADYYSQCEYVMGLRTKEGFELPVLEGLMCGARPVCFDTPHYRKWYEGLAEFIPESSPMDTVASLIEIFRSRRRSVTRNEREYVEGKFNWKTLVEGFSVNV